MQQDATHAAVVEDAGVHDDDDTDGLIEMETWDVARARLYGEARKWICTYFLDGYEQKEGDSARACTERETRRQSGETRSQKC